MMEPTQLAFLNQLEAILLSFLTVVVPAFGWWIVNSLKRNHDAAQKAADAAALAVKAAEESQATIIEKANGINEKILKRADDHTRALINAKDATIEALKGNQRA